MVSLWASLWTAIPLSLPWINIAWNAYSKFIGAVSILLRNLSLSVLFKILCRTAPWTMPILFSWANYSLSYSLIFLLDDTRTAVFTQKWTNNLVLTSSLINGGGSVFLFSISIWGNIIQRYFPYDAMECYHIYTFQCYDCFMWLLFHFLFEFYKNCWWSFPSTRPMGNL
jgi:hypothetical protein